MTRESDLSRLIRRKNRRKTRDWPPKGLIAKGKRNRKDRLAAERADRKRKGEWPGAYAFIDSPFADLDQGDPLPDKLGALGDWKLPPKNLVGPFLGGTLALPKGHEAGRLEEQALNNPSAFPDIWKTALQKEFAAHGQAPSERRLFDPMGPERLGPAEAPPLGHVTGSVDREGMITPRIALQKEWMTQPLREDQFSPQDPTYREQPYQRKKSLLWNSNLGKYQTA